MALMSGELFLVVAIPTITTLNSSDNPSGYGASVIFTASVQTNSTTAGNAFSLTVTAQDPFNNTVIGYSGTVHFSSGDTQASLPADATLTNGVGVFAAALKTAGIMDADPVKAATRRTKPGP